MPDYFGLPIANARLPGFERHQQGLIDLSRRLRQEDPEGLSRSNQVGWHSRDLVQFTDPHLDWLRGALLEFASVETQRRTKIKNVRAALSELWINVNPAGGHNAPHHHVGNSWSGVVYILAEAAASAAGKKGRKDGMIEFLNPYPMHEELGVPNKVRFPPKDGLAYLFPGALVHHVYPHQTQHDRISIAYNIRLSRAGRPPSHGG